jgi:hypothetical protein
MDIITAYEVEISDRDTGLALHCVALPGDAIAFDETGVPAWREELPLDTVAEVYLPSDASGALAAILLDPEHGDVAAEWYGQLKHPDYYAQAFERLPGYVLTFAEYAAVAPVIPLRQSPLELHSIASFMAGSSVTGGGAVLGIAVATGVASPLLLVYGPLGIILVGGAVALSEGLRYHIRRLMRVPDEPVTAEREREPS